MEVVVIAGREIGRDTLVHGTRSSELVQILVYRPFIPHILALMPRVIVEEVALWLREREN